MKPTSPFFAVIGLLALAGCATQQPKKVQTAAATEKKPLKTMRVRTTAYIGKRNALSQPLSHGPVISAASDWSIFPVGTKFRIRETGKTYIIDDYGSALVGTRTIDLAKRNQAGIKAWGARWVEIDILEWGSYRRSLEILTPRQHAYYVRPMVAALKRHAQGMPKSFHRIGDDEL